MDELGSAATACLMSSPRLGRIKDDPNDDDPIDITDWIPDIEAMIAKQQADPSLISPLAASLEDGAGNEPGSPSALAAAAAPHVGGDFPDPGPMSVPSTGGEYDHGEIPPPPLAAPGAAGSVSAAPAPAPQQTVRNNPLYYPRRSHFVTKRNLHGCLHLHKRLNCCSLVFIAAERIGETGCGQAEQRGEATGGRGGWWEYRIKNSLVH